MEDQTRLDRADPRIATTRAMYKFDIMATVVGVEVLSVRRPIDLKPYALAASTANLTGPIHFATMPVRMAGSM